MKHNKSHKFSYLLGFFIMIIGLGAVVLWESYGKQALLYTDVITASTDISKGTVITADMLQIERVEKDKVISSYLTDPSEVIGLESKQLIPQNAQISKSFCDIAGTVLKDDQYIFKVPQDWIISLPSSIRRKDTAIFYAVDYTTEDITANTNTASPSDGGENDEAVIESLKKSGKLLATTPVAYVKDSANREVVTLSKDERYDGSSQVASIEIIVDAEIVRSMENAISNGYKFIILYNEA